MSSSSKFALLASSSISRSVFKKSIGRRLRYGVWLLPIMMVLGLRVATTGWGTDREASAEWLTQGVEQKSVSVTITANGTVEGEQVVNLSPQQAGIVETLMVQEGDRVKRGQVIALMDADDLQGELLQAQGQLAQQQANLDRLVAGNRPEDIAKAQAQLAEAEASLQELRSGNRAQEIDQAQARLAQAQATQQQRESEFQRYAQLQASGAVSLEELEQKRANRDVANAQVREAQEALDLLNAGTRPERIEQAAARVEQQRQVVAALKAGSRSEDIEQAKAQVLSAQGALKSVEEKLQDTQVMAPFDGVIHEIYAEEGAFVSPSMAGGSTESASSSSILMLSSVRNHVVVNLPESQIGKVKRGQVVSFTADSFPGETFAGDVSHIASRASVSQNVTSFEVQIAIDDTAVEPLKIGMNVEAQFEVDRLNNVLLVPNAAVVRKAEGEGVYVLDKNGEPIFHPIQTGLVAGTQTEVKSGLQGNEEVLLSPPPESKKPGGFGFPPAPPPS
jgi:HlyD family secretion protein